METVDSRGIGATRGELLDFDVVVIGGGPAGMGAALASREEGARVALVERNAHLGGILRQCIHPGFGLTYFKEELTGPEYAQRFIDLVRATDIEVMLGSMVLAINGGASLAGAQGTGSTQMPEGQEVHPAAPIVLGAPATHPTAPRDKTPQPCNEEAARTLDCGAIPPLDNPPIHTVTVMTEHGIVDLTCRAVVLAMGCRERTRSEIKIPGSRPAGVFTAGLAQRYINIENLRPARRVVILGSGDIGLIMARRCALEGIEVEGVYELMPYANGLHRNVKNCLDDFGIPLHLSTTVTRVIGHARVEAVEVSRVDENLRPIPGTERVVPCDALLLSVGLIPENELSTAAGVELDPRTRGAAVDQDLQTSVPGIFSCGNVLHVHDLADNVTAEAQRAGRSAATYALMHAAPSSPAMPSETTRLAGHDSASDVATATAPSPAIRISSQGADAHGAKWEMKCPSYTAEAAPSLPVQPSGLASYVVPARITSTTTTKLYFRVKRPVDAARIRICSEDTVLFEGKPRAFKPSIMESAPLTAKMLERANGPITLSIDAVEEA